MVKKKVKFKMPPQELDSPVEFIFQDIPINTNLKRIGENINKIVDCLTGVVPKYSKSDYCDDCSLFQECTIVLCSMPIVIIINSALERLETNDKIIQ